MVEGSHDVEREEINTFVDKEIWRAVSIKAMEIGEDKRDFLGKAIKLRLQAIEKGEDAEIDVAPTKTYSRQTVNAKIEKGLWHKLSIKSVESKEKKYEFVEKALKQRLDFFEKANQ